MSKTGVCVEPITLNTRVFLLLLSSHSFSLFHNLILSTSVGKHVVLSSNFLFVFSIGHLQNPHQMAVLTFLSLKPNDFEQLGLACCLSIVSESIFNCPSERHSKPIHMVYICTSQHKKRMLHRSPLRIPHCCTMNHQMIHCCPVWLLLLE